MALLEDVNKIYNDITRVLIEKKRTISTMESCTCGLVATLLTNIQGASAIMKGAYVTYSNEAKIKNGVSKLDINVYGVYSEEVAKDMAEACKKEYGAYIGVGVTGVIDRPDPNNATKNPAIYYAICVEDKVITKKFTIPEEYQDRLTRKIYAVKIIGENLLEVVNNPELVREPLLIERDGIAELTKWR